MTSVLIVVPTLNSYRILSPLVDSLLAQTNQNWKVIFVDGNSSQEHKHYLNTLSMNHDHFYWEAENYLGDGIYGAMNQVFKEEADPDEWILFWGSDDMAASCDAIGNVIRRIDSLKANDNEPDLYVCSAQYFSHSSDSTGKTDILLGRRNCFTMDRTLLKALFNGKTPAHQATLFGPRVRDLLNTYDCKYKLAADLDYFLRLAHKNDVRIVVDDMNLVFIGDSGVSAKQNKKRTKEVYSIYKDHFGLLWFIPFILRYLRRLLELSRGLFNV